MKKWVILGVLLGLTGRGLSEDTSLVKTHLTWDSGVAYNATLHQLFATTTISVMSVWEVFDLRAGSLFTDTQTLWTAGIGIDVKALCNKAGGLVTYNLPFPIELVVLPAVDLTKQTVSVSVGATLLHVKF